VKSARREIAKVFEIVDLFSHADYERRSRTDPADGSARGRWSVRPRRVSPDSAISPISAITAGLPIGLQIVGAAFAESTVLALAYAYERTTEWHTRHPALRA
jgi:Asp-tRNA(Asn)/Glu-tRNA(Gln) amidotransferase A subunit family amidase